ncbi:MAG: hypothetical protein LBF93_02895 [Zoogloeaceae bacterium]|jgi:dolichyl-diphosphooligosaccharide--protein glycosyltransferase/undecaprenyl-diphosphooligosaccharide--protein glycosyltransferase|nr:hypothetical protein [Zoogloeaceae bacterium]
MRKWMTYIALRDDHVSAKTFCLLLLIAFVFGVAFRMIWIYQFKDVSQFHWNGQLMINSNDGYYWAEGARDILTENQNHYKSSPIHKGLPIITAFSGKMLPFVSFETLIFYLPVVLGSLLVVPIMLIAKAMNHTWAGFCAALIGVIAWSYYNRTMAGYYDDDMLVIVLSMLALFSLILALCRKNIYCLPIVTLLTMLSLWYYPQNIALLSAVAGILLVYTLIFHIKSLYHYQLLGFFLMGLLRLEFIIIVSLMIAALALFKLTEKRFRKTGSFAFLCAVFLLAFFFSPFMNILYQLNNYVFRTATLTLDSNATALNFFSVMQTVREAREIDFGMFAARISGHWTLFICACVGAVMMMFRHTPLLIALPFVALGFLAYGLPGFIPGGGLRFTIYAVPVLALGLAYLIFWVSERFSDRQVTCAMVALLCGGALYPHIVHIIDYKVPTVFIHDEVEALDRLGKKIERGHDYAISWWDYGYPIRYYTQANTLIDGGRHDGGDNFPTSFILGATSDRAAARLARLAVEVDLGFAKTLGGSSPMGTIMAHYQSEDPARFLRELDEKEAFALPPKTREAYLVLPFKMSNLFSMALRFSALDLATGKSYPVPMFIPVRGYAENGGFIEFGNGMRLEKKSGALINGNQRVLIKNIIVARFDEQGQYLVTPKTVNPSSYVTLIFLTHLNSVWIVDETALNSVYVRLFALQSYDATFFEPVVISPLMMIYRLRI